ncbi:MAG: TonB family protein [Bacteroidetes bacterium]|nr:TonB family protein [Bacteroidota bacterium]MDA0903099.1 TonB family protein [Bacteroidota bacterium]MDA1242346.1 TonB family protein [Bacteroidota bacterium]
MGIARRAVLYTLLAHVVVLGAMVWVPVSEGLSPSETYAEVWTVEEQPAPNSSQSYEDRMREAIAARVANLRADAQAQTSSEARSTQLSAQEQAALEAQVEAELRAMEADEFARLSAQGKEFDTAGRANVTHHQVDNTYEAWDAQYDGLVTVRYRLTNRQGLDLDVPGYSCRGGAQLEVAIDVDQNGRVVGASLVSGDPESCFGKAALRSARRARFNASEEAPKRQEGRLTYVFVAQ